MWRNCSNQNIEVTDSNYANEKGSCLYKIKTATCLRYVAVWFAIILFQKYGRRHRQVLGRCKHFHSIHGLNYQRKS